MPLLTIVRRALLEDSNLDYIHLDKAIAIAPLCLLRTQG